MHFKDEQSSGAYDVHQAANYKLCTLHKKLAIPVHACYTPGRQPLEAYLGVWKGRMPRVSHLQDPSSAD